MPAGHPGMSPARPLIEFRQVSLRFGAEILYESIDLDVREGELLCILGPSGCGKSTALRVLAGLLPVDGGTVTIDGESPEQRWRDMAFVFQNPRLLAWRTAKQNVTLGLELRQLGLGRAAMESRADDLLRLVGLAADSEKYPRMLSGGERQRVSLARALAVEPRIILMDEPFSALDPSTRRRMRNELVEIWQRTGKTIVFVTHDIDEALELADRIVLLSPKPTRVVETMTVADARPRAIGTSPSLAMLRDRILAGFHDAPADLGADAAPGEAVT
ncbi:MAG: ABC-type nitrate/sulfonate/bicarbonate transport system, ATPase component [Rhodospirillales bacterium]|nr:ABC-type nitrate/sulfonate/bicarbonate transport system, ATPase component [Rhodospirillales bacterium]